MTNVSMHLSPSPGKIMEIESNTSDWQAKENLLKQVQMDHRTIDQNLIALVIMSLSKPVMSSCVPGMSSREDRLTSTQSSILNSPSVS